MCEREGNDEGTFGPMHRCSLTLWRWTLIDLLFASPPIILHLFHVFCYSLITPMCMDAVNRAASAVDQSIRRSTVNYFVYIFSNREVVRTVMINEVTVTQIAWQLVSGTTCIRMNHTNVNSPSISWFCCD